MYPPIQNLRAFVAVVDTGQFRIAAEQIGVSESAVSHQIARLETLLDVQLLERGRNGVKMTDAGRIFYSQISTGLREIELGLDAIKRTNKTVVTISTPQTMSSLWLAPNLTSFYAENADVEVRVLATDRVCDLKAEGIDFSLRRGRERWDNCEHEWFCNEDIYPVANSHLKAQINKIGWDRTLLEIPLILNETHSNEWDVWASATGTVLPTYTKFRRLGSYDQVQAAAIHGLGIAMGRTPLCLEALSDGRLQRIKEQSCVSNEYQLLWPTDRRMYVPQHALLKWMQRMKRTIGTISSEIEVTNT